MSSHRVIPYLALLQHGRRFTKASSIGRIRCYYTQDGKKLPREMEAMMSADDGSESLRDQMRRAIAPKVDSEGVLRCETKSEPNKCGISEKISTDNSSSSDKFKDNFKINCRASVTSVEIGSVDKFFTDDGVEMKYESFFVRHSGDDEDRLHLMRISSGASENQRKLPSVFMVHGAIEHGAIFYNKKGKGLGSYLARHGYNVYVADLKGKGMSVPSIQQQAQRGRAFHGQHTYITETIPVLSDAALNLEGDRNPYSKNRQVWVSHSWGGVLMTSAYVRFPALLDRIACQAHFGTKRCISQIWSWEYFMRVALGWNFLCPLMGRFYGYVPCKKHNVGIEDETLNFVLECGKWAQKDSKWVDVKDGFNYTVALRSILESNNAKALEQKSVSHNGSSTSLPSTWHFSAKNDVALGHPLDVLDWAREAAQLSPEVTGVVSGSHKYTVLSKENGNLEDYDHNTMLTAKNAELDHFPQLLEWIRSHSTEKHN